MNLAGFALGALIARQNNVPAPQATTIALASGMIKSPLVGVLVASAVARNQRTTPPQQNSDLKSAPKAVTGVKKKKHL